MGHVAQMLVLGVGLENMVITNTLVINYFGLQPIKVQVEDNDSLYNRQTTFITTKVLESTIILTLRRLQ